MNDEGYIRTPKNIYRQFWPYLFSGFCISVALALNELLNGIIVSNLLGGQALAALNLTLPLTLISAALYTLCGYGPAVAIGNVLGKRDVKEAGKRFTLSVIFLGAVGGLFSLVGVMFRTEIAMRLVGESADMIPVVSTMVGILSAGGLFLMFTPFMAYIINVEGKPGYAVLLVTLANALNVALTVLFIFAFDMGVEAAAFSVVIGYFISFLVFFVLVYLRRIPFRLTKIRLKDVALLPPMLATGLPAAASLFLMAVQINVMNRLSFLSAGTDGVVIFSVCLGAYALVGMFYQGVTDTLPPILSVLRGAGDVNGQRYIIKRVFVASAVLCAAGIVTFALFPQLILNLYGLEPRLLTDAADCIRLYTVGMSVIVFVLFFLDYLQSIERRVFAMVISLLKNIVCVLPPVWLFSTVWGVRGVMLGFSVGMVLTVFVIAAHNLAVSRRSGSRLKGLLLLPSEDDTARFEATIPISAEAAVALSENVARYCADGGVDKRTGYLISLAVEELAMFTLSNRKNATRDRIDVFLTFEETEATLIFCVSGKPFDVYDHAETGSREEEITNLMLLKKISASISFERILLMNRTILNFSTTHSEG